MIAAALKQDERLLQDMASKADAQVAQEVLRNARTFHIAWIEMECERREEIKASQRQARLRSRPQRSSLLLRCCCCCCCCCPPIVLAQAPSSSDFERPRFSHAS